MKKIIIILLLNIITLFSQDNALSDWFEFAPHKNFNDSQIMMSDWLDSPAGKYGFVKNINDKLIFENGKEIKFWGLNICSGLPYSDSQKVNDWAETLSNFGINSVRFHKFTSHGLLSNSSTDLTKDKYKNLDYFHSRLKSRGIYYGWSPIYGHKPKIGDSTRLIAYDEISNANLNNHLSYSTIGLVNFAEDLQNLHIELITNMLNHKNPFTGLRYAEDPALAFIELQNEDNIFFSTTKRMIDKCPSYKKLLTNKFTDWLSDKYQSTSDFNNAWGSIAFEWGREVMEIDWDIEKSNITPVVNHGIYDYEFNKYQSMNQTMPQFLLDMATFLYQEQVKFYKKFEEAIRATGYKGVIVGSCWQAGSGISHYYNLNADYKVGIIDRHNYYGGGTGHRLIPGSFNNNSMLSSPGSGLLSLGMQQVIDRPFAISEWLSLIPNEWVAEGSPIIAAYGLGLQGWDASFSFASDTPFYTSQLHTPGVYNVMSPLQLSLYPTLARMVYRNDISEGKIISVRNVNLNDLAQGKINFNERFYQNRDIKDYIGSVPSNYLAAGKVVVEFNEESKESVIPTSIDSINNQTKRIVSNTDELVWNYSSTGYFTINTDNTQGIIGFADSIIHLNDVSIKSENEFSIILLTSLEKNKSINKSNNLLITTVARARNSGMRYNKSKTEILDVGTSPILMEPVNATIKLNLKNDHEVYALDHMGVRTGRKLEEKSQTVYLDGKRYKTIYYQIIVKN